jgi:tripartite-type tricarboxylate transporter receptor subunit TctC
MFMKRQGGPMRNNLAICTAAALSLASIGTRSAPAQDFFKGKDITIYTGSASGGPYDAYARLVARHFASHIPGNPSIIVQAMPGAAGRRMMGYMQNLAPKDGTVIAASQRAVPFDPLTVAESHFDARQFGWLGSANGETNVCMVWHTSPIRTLDDLYKREMVVGTSGPSSTDAIYPNVINNLFGTKFKVVTGYKGAAETNIAIERGEVDGRCGISWDTLVALNQEWLQDKKIRLLVQFALDKNPQLPDVPSVFDMAKTDEQRQILTFWATPNKMGRPFALPPGTPPDRVTLMRHAFEETMKDPQLIAEAAKMKLAVDSIGGEEVTKLIQELYSLPKDVIAKAAEASKGPS